MAPHFVYWDPAGLIILPVVYGAMCLGWFLLVFTVAWPMIYSDQKFNVGYLFELFAF